MLRKNLDVKPSRESNVINDQLQVAADPEVRDRAGERLCPVLSSTSASSSASIPAQASTASSSRSAARSCARRWSRRARKLTAYQRDKGIVGTDDRLDVENARLNELSSQLVIAAIAGRRDGGP